MKPAYRLSALSVSALLLSGCVANPPLQSAQSCFESYGLMVFDGSGGIECMSEAEYVLSRETSDAELASFVIE